MDYEHRADETAISKQAQNKVRFTEGPWKYADLTGGPMTEGDIYQPDRGYIHVMGPNAAAVCDVFPFAARKGVGYETALANARLIAAAPELYEALKACEDALARSGHWANRHGSLIMQARAALAKVQP